MARTKTNTQNNTKTSKTPRRNRNLEKKTKHVSSKKNPSCF